MLLILKYPSCIDRGGQCRSFELRWLLLGFKFKCFCLSSGLDACLMNGRVRGLVCIAAGLTKGESGGVEGFALASLSASLRLFCPTAIISLFLVLRSMAWPLQALVAAGFEALVVARSPLPRLHRHSAHETPSSPKMTNPTPTYPHPKYHSISTISPSPFSLLISLIFLTQSIPS